MAGVAGGWAGTARLAVPARDLDGEFPSSVSDTSMAPFISPSGPPPPPPLEVFAGIMEVPTSCTCLNKGGRKTNPAQPSNPSTTALTANCSSEFLPLSGRATRCLCGTVPAAAGRAA